jgi:hypothetical protein
LAQDLAPRPRVFQLIVRRTREGVSCDVAHAIAARLDAVHLDIGER